MKRGEAKVSSDSSTLHELPDALVALYLTEETGLPCTTKDYEMSVIKAQDSTGTLLERPALRVTFKKNASIKQQHHLLTFGSDQRHCNIILNANEASPIHCKVYAQLNSGPNVFVIEDNSANGTEYVDEESQCTRISKSVIRGRVAAHGLCRIRIGRNIFGFSLPLDKEEIAQRERWFSGIDPILVTRKVLQEQLRGAALGFCQICPIGKGGMAQVFQHMEKTTGLMIAVKEEKVKGKEADERIQKEIAYMQSLRHVSPLI